MEICRGAASTRLPSALWLATMQQSGARASMRNLAIGEALLALGACAEAGSLENILEICGKPDASPQDTVRFCQRALASEKLDSQARAEVNVNLGIGYFELGHYGAAIDAYSTAIDD